MPMKRLIAANTKECLWIYILLILHDKPMHAYAIRTEIARRYGFMPGTMTAYKVLYLLGRRGLVTKTSAGRRKMYRITAPGMAALRDAKDFYQSRLRLFPESI